MVKLQTELSVGFDRPLLNQAYVIIDAKEIQVEDTRRNKEYPAIRVTMKNAENLEDKVNYTLSLWLSEQPTPNSKLGSFIQAFLDFFKGSKDAYETDNWKEHTIKLLRWRDKDRQIEVIK